MTTTTDLGKFGFREIKMVSELLNAWIAQGLPRDFDNNEVVAMMNGEKLESFYSSPYDGKEGFFEDLVDEYPEMHREDQEWFRQLAENNHKELPELAD